MKKITVILLVLLLSLSALSGCTKGQTESHKKLKIVVTTFPAYDWTKNILGDKINDVDLTLLIKNGVDLHSYQPTTEDIVKIGSADVFIYVGGESDHWVKDALKERTNKDMKIVNLVESLGEAAKEEEVVPGMEAEDESHSDEHHDEDKDSHGKEEEDSTKEEEAEIDEHVWLSLRNAKILTEAINKALDEADPKDKDVFDANGKAYIEKLTKLDEEYKSGLAGKKKDTIVVGDRFPFRYLVDDYNIKYYAAFTGCSAETEASFQTVVFLAKKVDENELDYIITIDGSDGKIARAIGENTKEKSKKTLTLDSMQSTKVSGDEKDSSYLDIMKENLETLKKALT